MLDTTEALIHDGRYHASVTIAGGTIIITATVHLIVRTLRSKQKSPFKGIVSR
ncbi:MULTISPECIES: hypothetical protein [Microvirga]|uniref:hypothetical protein n=1 Tax=Microvirga TaxID=186650 RepID=UPI000308D617|nr:MULTISPECIES: hypothetical protein [Microvirga]